MGNSVNPSQGKSTGSSISTGMPAWAKVGSDAYKNMNSTLQTAPMALANQTFAQGGMGQTSQNAVNRLGNMGGSNSWMDQAARSFQNVGQLSEDPYRQMIGQAGQPGAAEQYLTGYARGDYLNGSPELDNIINQTNQKTADQVNQMFAAGGRLGSGTNQGVLADSIAQNTSNLLYNNYNQQQQSQLNAANALESAQQGRMGLGLNAASGLAGVQGQNIGNQLGAAGQLGSLGQSAFGNQMQSLLGAAGLENQGYQNMLGMVGQLPTIQNNKVFDSNQQMGIGSQLDQKTQAQLNDLINQWTQKDMEPWARLGGLLSAGVNSAGSWGTKTSETTQPPDILGLLGNILTASVPGGGSLIGKALSGVSDRRAKENIKRVGTTKHGLPLYEFSYIGHPDERWRGVMAHEVLEVMPEAVSAGPGGYLAVDYDKLGMKMERVHAEGADPSVTNNSSPKT